MKTYLSGTGPQSANTRIQDGLPVLDPPYWTTIPVLLLLRPTCSGLSVQGHKATISVLKTTYRSGRSPQGHKAPIPALKTTYPFQIARTTTTTTTATIYLLWTDSPRAKYPFYYYDLPFLDSPCSTNHQYSVIKHQYSYSRRPTRSGRSAQGHNTRITTTYPFWRVRTGPQSEPPGGRRIPAQEADSEFAREGSAARTRLLGNNS